MPEQLKLSALKHAPRTGFWPALAIFLICASASFGSAGCSSGDRRNGNGAGVASSSPATSTDPPRSTAPTRVVPAGPVPLSQEILDTTVKTLDGGSLKLSDYDNKVVVLNIWATWCGPCRQEMPDLVKISSEYKSRGVVVLGVATEYNERQGQAYVRDFIRTNGITYRIIWDDGTLDQPLRQAVNARPTIPQSFVISRDGKIVKHFPGFNPLSTPTLMRQAVEEALNHKSKA
ncbi:MAG TPA: TlpA disulfide reductase family protein [Pyrinomonadaceae bacterium]|jgi:thiol-disulfide isomerase/thioredoxin|nr:TlpA disulfide reductase family protein [Pyrinomonadaceae bacterium]